MSNPIYHAPSPSENPTPARMQRRDFLKLSAAGLLSVLAVPYASVLAAPVEQQGRVAEGSAVLYETPSFNSEALRTFWKDAILPITQATIGDAEPEYNRVWYQIGQQGFVHSGPIQPVQTVLNEPRSDIPPEGALAEITVPYSDALWGPGTSYPFAYRFYYETTHWVKKLVADKTGEPWYKIQDDKWKFYYYAPARHLRLIPYDELLAISPQVPAYAKRIEVNTAAQSVVAYEWDRPVFMTRAATGAKFSNGDFSTPAGHHVTSYKRPYRHMAAGNLAANGYDLPGVPWVTYITESGISFHGTYWHNNYGKPRSHGCINLTPKAAKWIYRWTLPHVPPSEQSLYEETGTSVDVISKPAV